MSETRDSKGMKDLAARIASSGGKIIVDFKGSYCPPCKELEPILEELAQQYRETLEVIAIDIEEHPDLAQQFGVRSVPTLIAFYDGKVCGQQVGFSHRRRVQEMFAELARLS